MQRATQGSHKDPGKEVEDFAERLQCAEEMQVCNDETVQDTMDSAWGVIDPEFAASVLENERYRSNPYYFSTKQPLLSPLMRAVLFDWMMEVSHSFRLRRETYYLAVLAVDAGGEGVDLHIFHLGTAPLSVAADLLRGVDR